ncbi:MAG: FAD-dependent oxidoreductase [Pseudomonadota bacterium]
MEHVMEAGMTLMPAIGKARVLRSWGGIMDMSPDGSPIIDKTQIDGLFIDCGWCYGGFKAVPGSGHVMARPRHRLEPAIAPPTIDKEPVNMRLVDDG